MVSLEHLDLSYNMIKSVSSDAFRGLVNLKVLNLNWNEIDYASLNLQKKSLFSDLLNLRELHTSNQLLMAKRNLSLYDFLEYLQYLKNLKYLNVACLFGSDDKFKFDFNSLNFLVNLEKFICYSNNLNMLDSTIKEKVALTEKLVHLDLAENSLEKLSTNLFKNFFNIHTLDLRRNSIEIIQDNLFFDLKSLKILNLSQNKLKKIEKQAFKGLNGLEKLFIDATANELIDFSSLPLNLSLIN